MSRRGTPRGWSLAQRMDFYSIPEPTSGCWLWMGPTDSNGYGILRVGKRMVSVPRAILGLCRGDIRVACHRCDNPPCVNPAHLFPGTVSDNSRDMVRKNRHPLAAKTHCKRGHPYDEANTRVSMWAGSKRRQCRKCNAISQRKRAATARGDAHAE